MATFWKGLLIPSQPPQPKLEPSCMGCAHWDHKYERHQNRLGGCRRHAPGWGETPHGEGYPGRERKWPVTRGDDWCGDFAPFSKSEGPK